MLHIYIYIYIYICYIYVCYIYNIYILHIFIYDEYKIFCKIKIETSQKSSVGRVSSYSFEILKQ